MNSSLLERFVSSIITIFFVGVVFICFCLFYIVLDLYNPKPNNRIGRYIKMKYLQISTRRYVRRFIKTKKEVDLKFLSVELCRMFLFSLYQNHDWVTAKKVFESNLLDEEKIYKNEKLYPFLDYYHKIKKYKEISLSLEELAGRMI